MGDRSHRVSVLCRAGLAAFALVWLALVGTLAVRSTETWIPVDPALAQRLLDLSSEQRRLARAWESAQRGETRFQLDTEIRFVAARIDEIETIARQPRPTHGLAPWARLAPVLRPLAVFAAEIVAATLVALALAGLIAGPLARLRPRSRILALATLLAPLGLPPPLFAAAVADLGRSLGLAPSPGLAFAGLALAVLPAAVIALALAGACLPRSEIASAEDLGLSPLVIGRRIVLPRLAPTLAIVAVAAVLRLTSDLSIGRIVGAATAPTTFGEWLRHRIVAAIDFPSAAAGALAAFALAAGFAALLAIAAARLAPPPGSMPRLHALRPLGDDARHAGPDGIHPGSRGAEIVAAALIGLSLALLLAVARRVLTGLAPSPLALDPRAAEAIGEFARAGLAAGLALLGALAVAVAVERSGRCRSRPFAALALIAPALPPPMLGLGLRLLADAADLPVGAGVAVLAQTLAALGPVAALLVAHLPPSRLDGLHAPLRPTLAPVLPLAAVIGFAVALAVADLGSILGLVDRTALLRPPALGLADPAALIAIVAAVLLGLGAAAALETARGRGFDP